MPPTDKYNEILLGVITGIIILLVVACVVVFILLYYQKRRFQHRQKISDMEKEFSEELLKSQLEIQEHTFNHISQEIHDNVGQILSLAKVQVNIMNESNNIEKSMLFDLRDNIGKALTDLRDIAKSLSSERIKSLGIHSVVAQEAERINKSQLFRINVVVHEKEKMMEDQKKLILFRIIQECLQNIVKHANASEVMIDITYSPDFVRAIVKDNGKGFNKENMTADLTGLGLSNIKNRASLAGGRSIIESAPGLGTAIIVEIPYE